MKKRASPDWLTRQTYAHRGLHSPGVVENSRSAVTAALAAGFGIECDVQMSRDNVPLVFHDWKLDRLTGHNGNVAEQSAEDLCQIALRDSVDTIWTLADLLECVAGRAPILIEIKSRPDFDSASACAAVEFVVRNYAGPFAIMSFDPSMGEWFAKHAPSITRGLVATDTLDHGFIHAWRAQNALERAEPDFLACDIRDLPNAPCDLWRETGRPLLTWTVRTAELRAHAKVNTDAAIAEGAGIK